MPIVLISEALLLRSTLSDGRILRDRVLCGFCVRMNARKRSFKVATSVAGKQFRMVLGYWPLMSVDVARALASEVLRECRAGQAHTSLDKALCRPSLGNCLAWETNISKPIKS